MKHDETGNTQYEHKQFCYRIYQAPLYLTVSSTCYRTDMKINKPGLTTWYNT